jgi:hypothetical protein
MAVGIVAGVVGGFLLIVMGIYFWRRHRRRQHLERLGSMEELTRAPSPPLLSRSLTRGATGPRQPIDDDDDFLTPMDTLPNTHHMDDYPHHDDNAAYFEDSKSVYSNEDHDGGPPDLPHDYPVPPPAAVVPANGRYYSGEGSRPGTAGSMSAGGGGSGSGAIPSYSAMNKYTALSAGGGSGGPRPYSPAGGAAPRPYSPAVGAAVTSNSAISSFSRPGAGYRGHDTHNNGSYH